MKKILLNLILLAIFCFSSQAQTDNCAGATVLTAAQLNCGTTGQNLTGTTVGATTVSGIDFTCIDGSAEIGVWYQFTAQGPDIEILNNGAAPAPYVAITSACPVTAPDVVYCDQLDILDMDGEGDDLLITGNTYYIWVGFLGNTGAYDICVTNPPAPGNDECVNAFDITPNILCLTGGGSTITGTTEFAGPDGIDIPGCIDAGSNSWEGVWYSFVAQGYDLVIDDVMGNSPYVFLLDAGCAGGTFIFCGQTPMNLTDANNGDNMLTIGQTYHIWVGFNGGNEETFELCVDNPEPPMNDDCVTADPIDDHLHCITGNSEALEGDIYGAFPEALQIVAGSCLPYAVNGWEGIWYSFTAVGHDLIIESGGNEDPYVVIYDDCPANGGNPIICGQTPFNLGDPNDINNPTNPDINNAIDPSLIGTTLYMWVGFDGGIDSMFSLCIENGIPPINDQCGGALPIEDVQCDGTNTVLGSTNFASFYDFVYVWDPGDAPGIQTGCFNPYPPDGDEVVWYTFEATGVDLEIEDLMGNNPSFMIFNNVMCGPFTVDDIIACGELPYSYETEGDLDDLFNVGDQYLLMIAFPGGWAATDSFELCINIPTPPPNDLCENAQVISPGELDCPDFDTPIWGYTTNSSQDGLFWTDLDPLVDLDCALDTLEDDGVWYQFTAIGTDLVITDQLGNDPTIVLMQWDPCEADTVSVVFCEQTPISDDFGEVGNNAVTIGQDYLMYVTFQGGESNTDTFELCIDNEGMCSSPTPPSSYCQTTPLCGLAALDAYCMNMEVNGGDENWPGCNVFLHDPNWFSFVAGSDNLSIQVQISDCLTGAGVQIEMYEIDCTTDLGPNQPPCPASDLAPPLANCIFSETAQPPGSAPIFNVATEFGHVYGIVFDGWGGDLCTIEIDVLEGADPPSLDGIMLPEPEWDDDAFPFEGDTICAGAEDVRFAVDQTTVVGACRFDWTLDGVTIPDGTNDFEEFIDFPDPGLYEVCFFASNFCDSTEPVCVEVFVAALDPVETIDTICEGDDYVWMNPFGGIFPFNPAFDSEEGGDYVYTSFAQNLAGCEVDATLYLHVLEENDDNPTPIDTVICVDDVPFDLFGVTIPVNTSTGEILDFELDAMLAHDGQCDSFFIVDVFSLDATILYEVVRPPLDQPHVNCVDSLITVCPLQVNGNPFFTPDPAIYPDVEIHYTWLTVPFGDTVGTDDICLTAHFNDFDNTGDNGQTFEVVVTMTKGGRPAGGCTFGPFEVELVLPDFIPDVEILGPDTVCIGPEFDYEILPFITANSDVWPTPIDFQWDLSGFPGAMRTEIDEFNHTFTFSQITTGFMCVTAIHPCSNSPLRCKEVVVVPPPVPDPGLDAEECTNDYQLNAGNPSGTWYTSSGPLGAIDPVFSDVNDPNATVTISDKGEYTFGWITMAYGCADTGYVNIDFIEPMSIDGDIDYMCDNVHENFTAEFTFIGGVAPYVVTSGNGTLNGMTFTSDPIPAGDTVLVLITDDQGCTGSFPLTWECPCLTEGAVMNTSLIERCGETCLQVSPFTAPIPDPNDIVIYVLHTSSTDMLGTVIEENLTGEFCLTGANSIQYGIQYYVSIVVGNDVGGTVDLSHPCTQIAPGQPVIWYEIPAPDAGSDMATCASSIDLSVSNSQFPGVWEIINTETNVTFSDQSSPTSTLNALGCGIVELRWIETNEICSDTTEVNIEFYCNPTNTPPIPTCNMDQTELTFSFMLNGVGPFTETNGRGTITGNDFELDGLIPPTTVDTLYFEDGNGCSLVVPLPEADCNCLPIIVGDTICGLATTIVSDGTGNGGMWQISPNNMGTGSVSIATPNNRSTDISVSEYGIYTFGWTENGNLCDGYAEIDVYFVNSPEIDLSSVDTVCNGTYDGYVVTFEIINGHPGSYVVFDENGLPVGQLVGNQFTSNEIPSTQPVQFNVTDGFGCDTFTFDFVNDCGCFTSIGNLDDTPLNLCVGDMTSVAYDIGSESADDNDVRIYILYTDQNDPLNSIIAENPNGVFSFIDPPMVRGNTYYVSAVLGTESTVTPGLVNYNDPCLSISPPMPVTWYDATVPSITSTEVEFTCLIVRMNLNVTIPDDINDYNIVWSTTDGSIEPGDENVPNPQINSPGTYTVTLTHAIADCPSSTQIQVGQSDDVPEVNIQFPMLLTCERDQVSLSGVGSDTGPTISYQWTGPGIVGVDTTLDIIVDQVGQYTLTLVDRSNGCTVSEPITVNEDVTDPDVSANVAELLDCNTTEVTLSGQGSSTGPQFEYNWSVISVEGNIVGSSTDINAVANEAGTYQLEVRNSDNGCVSTRTVNVDVDDSVIQDAIIDVKQPGCDGLNDGYISVIDVIGGTSPFMFSFDGGEEFSSSDRIDDLGAGTYEVVITDDNGCEYREAFTLTAPVDFFVDLGETILVDFGDPVTILAETNLPDSLVLSVTWSPLYDSLNPSSYTQQFYPDLGQQNVNISIVNLNGCVQEDNVLVVAKFAERIYIPTAMNPTSTNPQNRRIYIFANPESVAAIHYFEIYDRWGERVFQRGAMEPSLTIDPDNAWDGTWQNELAHAGVYVYYAEVEFITGVKKIIKGDFTLIR